MLISVADILVDPIIGTALLKIALKRICSNRAVTLLKNDYNLIEQSEHSPELQYIKMHSRKELNRISFCQIVIGLSMSCSDPYHCSIATSKDKSVKLPLSQFV